MLISLFSSPEDGVHPKRAYQKDVQEVERPDNIVSIMSQFQWSRRFQHGEANIAEATENHYALGWGLHRLGYSNRNVINKDNINSSFAFQSKGHSVTFYVTKPLFDGIYIMAELNIIQMPKSIDTLKTLIIHCSLMCLMQVTYIFKEFSSMKKDEPSLKQFEALVSENKDQRRNSSVRF
ncbi:MAG: hypothetical protein EXX96DRAFT_610258 [Benjaminiella poitrasii]|nr:MAG: hypothetical protein EXX96DRAFT_610258 [Benjaminiella poitrasii]